MSSTCRGGLGVTISMMGRWGVDRGSSIGCRGMMGGWVDWVDRVDWVVGHWVMGHGVVRHSVMWHMGMNWISVTLFCFGFGKRYDKWHQ